MTTENGPPEREGQAVGRHDVVALFEDRLQAERAIAALSDAGFAEEQIGFLTPGEDTEPSYFGRVGKSLAGGTVAGAAAGAILGGLATVLIPGAGLAVAGGTILAAAMGGMTGGATGMVAGLLFGASASPDQATYYSQEVQRGRSLVSIAGTPEEQVEARRILLEMGAMEAAPMSPEGS
jgi:hypothetical protein